jgi:predicted GIY-YIG superfamily endonuclease
MRAIKSTPGKDGQQSRWVVYRYFAGDGTLLYVGVTSQWSVRHRHHRAQASWYAEGVRYELEHYEDRGEAARREAEIINAENPQHNRRRIATAPPYPQADTVLAVNAPGHLMAWLRAQADRRNMSVNAYVVLLLEGLREFYEERASPPLREKRTPQERADPVYALARRKTRS